MWSSSLPLQKKKSSSDPRKMTSPQATPRYELHALLRPEVRFMHKDI